MALFSLAQRTTSGVAATPAWEVRSGATNRPKLMELGISQVTAVAGQYGLGRPAAIGVGPTSPVQCLPEEHETLAGQSQAAVAWTTTAPTVPAAYYRRVICAATIGTGVIWTFPKGLTIPAAGSLVVWIIATAPVCDMWAVVDE